MDAPTVGELVRRLRAAAAAAGDAEYVAVLAFDELLRRAGPFPEVHAALVRYATARVGTGVAIVGHLRQVAEALDTAAAELERDDARLAGVLR